MPSPFPGMDPFLEDPAFFPDLHDSLIIYIREQLQPLLPEPYYVASADRVWVESVPRQIGPDVNVLRGQGPSGPQAGQGGVAVLTQAPIVPVVIRVPQEEMRETYLDLLARLGDEEHVVATIEILSPANKVAGVKSRDLYLRKQQEILAGRTHLIEIDLLRSGKHATAIPHERLIEVVPTFDYHVCIHHFDNVEDYFIYPILLSQPLPTISVPLLPGDGFVSLNLQAAFQRAYETGPYSRRVRYTNPVPPPKLEAAQQTWVEERLRARGLLPTKQDNADPS